MAGFSAPPAGLMLPLAPLGEGEGSADRYTTVLGVGLLSGQGHTCQKLPRRIAISNCNLYQMPFIYTRNLLHSDEGAMYPLVLL